MENMESIYRRILMIKYYHKYLLLLIIIFAVGVKGQDLGLVLPDIEEYQLNNGMRILISPNYESPVVYINMQINIGKIDNPKDMPGLGKSVFSQLKNATKIYPKKGQLENKLYSLGNSSGSFGAYSFDDYYSTINHICLKEDTKDCIEIFSELVRYPTFAFSNKFWKKLTQIWAPKEIFGNRWNSTMIHVNYMFNGLLNHFNDFKKYSYTSKQEEEWFNKNIRPENITLMISGDINYIYIKKLVNDYFGDWKSDFPMPKIVDYNINITENSGINVQFTSIDDAREARIVLRKKTTDLNDSWNPAMQMAMFIFYHNRLEQVKQNIDRAGWIGWGWQQSNRMPYTEIIADMEYSYLDRFYSELIYQFEDVSNNTITDEDLKNAVITRTNDYQNKTYNPKELNDMVQYYYNQNGYSIERVAQLVDDIKAVTLDGVNAAAKKVFDPNNFVMAIAGNKDSCATFLDQFPNIEYYERAEEIRTSASSP